MSFPCQDRLEPPVPFVVNRSLQPQKESVVTVSKRRGIVLMNLGTPDSPSVRDVRKYLRQFLMDERVLDIPFINRFLLVNGIITPVRSPRSAKLYKSVWMKGGSPLMVHSLALAEAISTLRPEDEVVIAMRYGQPSTKKALDKLKAAGVEDALLVPLYPHYALSSYETAVVEAQEVYNKGGYTFSLDILPPYFDRPAFLDVLADSIRPYVDHSVDHVLFSYHGIPERHVRKCDPTGSHCLSTPDCCSGAHIAHATCYRHQCFHTSREVAARLELRNGQWGDSFQSRLGRDPWLQPYTAELLKQLPDRGIKNLVVVCPAFSADCLETLEEMDVEGRDLFLEAGGERFTRVPCLNASPAWVAALNQWLDPKNVSACTST
jgi:ferrochelatase